jgi:hypothetical protein
MCGCMQIQANLSDASLEQIIEHILSARKINRSDQSHFMALLLAKKSLTKAEETQVNRVFDGLRKGLIRVVD